MNKKSQTNYSQHNKALEVMLKYFDVLLFVSLILFFDCADLPTDSVYETNFIFQKIYFFFIIVIHFSGADSCVYYCALPPCTDSPTQQLQCTQVRKRTSFTISFLLD
jgi:hypothetical protein